MKQSRAFFQQRWPEAEDFFQRALRLNPNMEEVRIKVIQLQRSLKDD